MSLDFDLVADLEDGSGETLTVFDANYTHNVTPMWIKAGVYDALYNSDGQLAWTIAETLRSGIAAMQKSPEEYLKLNPSNGWGDYYTALKFLNSVYSACVYRPSARISISK